MNARWRIQLLGELRVVQEEHVITRFRTQMAGALLAYLAYHLGQAHPRERLIDLIWPEADLSAGRHCLSQELSSLRHQLEPPGVPRGAVLDADRFSVRLNPAAVTTDVAEFRAVLRAAAQADTANRRAELLTRAVDCYQGELLPGYYEEWISTERDWLAERYFQALDELLALLEEAGDWQNALEYARQGLRLDRLREETHLAVMRLCAAMGQSDAALRQYGELERLFEQELDDEPSATARELAERIKRGEVPAIRRSNAQRPGSTSPHHPPAAAPPADRVIQFPEPPEVSPRECPRPAASGTSESRLPIEFTRFFGREAEIARLTELLSPLAAPGSHDGGPATPPTRLLTLTGAGGTGKTRLALAVARRLLEPFQDAVWFVRLADLREAEQIADAIRDALRLPRSRDVAPLDQAVEALSQRPSLLVLDNFEHLVDEGARTVRTLLERVPHLTCLVTSRQRLNLEAEREFPVAPLPTPGDGRWWMVDGSWKIVEEGRSLGGPLPSTINHPPSTMAHQPSPEHLIQYPSVQLFVDRAQAVRPDFQVTTANAATVAELCDRLEGIPLALELAAARAKTLSPAQILARLERRLDFLASRRRDGEERHQTLRATLEWSYRLLVPELQRFFPRLSVFRGGWTLEAAEAVCACGASSKHEALSVETDPLNAPRSTLNAPFAEGPVLDCLEQLRECSLIEAEEEGDEIRYRLRETIRVYAWSLLEETGEAEVVRARHRNFFLHLAERAEPEFLGGAQKEWLERLQTEQDNLRAALEWCVARRPSRVARPEPASDTAGARETADETRDAHEEAGLRLAGALWKFWFGLCLWSEGRRWLDEMLASSPDAPAALRLEALVGAGVLAFYQDDYAAAAPLAEESLALSRELQNPRGIAFSLIILGSVDENRGDRSRAEGRFGESLAHARAEGDPFLVALSLQRLGSVAYREGRSDQAASLLEESLKWFRQVGEAWGMAVSLEVLGRLAFRDGDYQRARTVYEQVLELFRKLGYTSGIAAALRDLGIVACRQGDYPNAASLLKVSLKLQRTVGGKQGLVECLEALAEVANGQRQGKRAARLFGAAKALREALGTAIQPAERADYERNVAAVRAGLGEESFTAAWAQGLGMTLDEAFADALETAAP